jgi:uncharacterized coiled-coil protein SlyX
VTPEAHSYFLRIVKVTQSELEKLLVYKIQHLLAAPVAPSILGATALEELGTAVTARLQMPGASTAAHIAEIEGRKSCGSLRHRSTQEKAVEEGRELTKYLISMMGRILADFGRLADTVLRWQLEKGAMYSGGLNVNDCRDGDTFQLTEPENIPKTSNDFKDFLERLERQDRQNSELEAKYNKVVDEQHTDRRAFMRERQLWREQLRQLKARLKRSKDPSLASLLDHDVQFFDGGEDRGEEEDIEDLRQRYEDRIARMQEDYEERITELESLLEKLRLKLQALEERAARKSSEVRSASKESKSEAGADMEELMRLRQELEASKAENESLREELGRLQAQLQEAQEERSRLQDALSKYYADLESQPQRVHASTQASAPETRPVRRLKTEILQRLSIDIAPIELPPLLDEEALEEARAKILELERLLKEAEAREAAILAERDKLRKDLQDKMTQCELLEKELAEQKRLLDKASQASVAKRVAAAQTDPWQPDRLPPDDKALREKDELLEELRRRIKELEAICQDRQRTIDELRKQLAAALERIRKLEASQVVPPEEDSPPPPPVPRGSRRGSKGGGWTLVRRKDLGSILPEQDERRYWLPTSWPSPASRVFEGKKRGGMPLEIYCSFCAATNWCLGKVRAVSSARCLASLGPRAGHREDGDRQSGFRRRPPVSVKATSGRPCTKEGRSCLVACFGRLRQCNLSHSRPSTPRTPTNSLHVEPLPGSPHSFLLLFLLPPYRGLGLRLHVHAWPGLRLQWQTACCKGCRRDRPLHAICIVPARSCLQFTLSTCV